MKPSEMARGDAVTPPARVYARASAARRAVFSPNPATYKTRVTSSPREEKLVLMRVLTVTGGCHLRVTRVTIALCAGWRHE